MHCPFASGCGAEGGSVCVAVKRGCQVAHLKRAHADRLGRRVAPVSAVNNHRVMAGGFALACTGSSGGVP